MNDDQQRADRVARYLNWITPTDSLDAVAAEPRELVRRPPPWATEEEVELSVAGVERLARAEAVPPAELHAVEAIILPTQRPVLDVVDGTFPSPGPPFEHLDAGDARAHLEAAIPAVGRIELPDHPALPYGGTGFVVGEGLLMTNRHVAELFASGLGAEDLAFITGQTAAVDFKREHGRPDTALFRIDRVLMVHPHWDMALLSVAGLEAVTPLRLAVADPEELLETTIAVIGYPARKPDAEDPALQDRLFEHHYDVKRLQPGLLRKRADVRSYDHVVSAVTHDCTTLGGNSGSAMVEVETGTVVGLHFAGAYLVANYAVPSSELARDRRVVRGGVTFDGPAPAGATPWDAAWTAADPPRAPEPARPDVPAAAPAGAAATFRWTIPLEVSVEVRAGEPQAPGAAAAAVTAAGVERVVEPWHDPELATRRGYDDRFLGLRVPLPRLRDRSAVSRLDDGTHVLRYEHFSIVMHRARRLALLTAANVDASPARKEPEPGRDYSRRGLGGLGPRDTERWFTDPRVPELHQLPDRFFTRDRGAFDRGHLVRREDVAWGDDYDEVRRANGDTFHVTNCTPQVAGFNQSTQGGLWGRLENLVFAQARQERFCVLAGPVLAADDPFFAGVDQAGPVRVAIPRRFWKLVVARAGDRLQAFAFVLEQDLSRTDLEFAPGDAFRTHMRPVKEVEDAIGILDFPNVLLDADRFGEADGEAVRAAVEAAG